MFSIFLQIYYLRLADKLILRRNSKNVSIAYCVQCLESQRAVAIETIMYIWLQLRCRLCACPKKSWECNANPVDNFWLYTVNLAFTIQDMLFRGSKAIYACSWVKPISMVKPTDRQLKLRSFAKKLKFCNTTLSRSVPVNPPDMIIISQFHETESNLYWMSRSESIYYQFKCLVLSETKWMSRSSFSINSALITDSGPNLASLVRLSVYSFP